LDEKSVIPHNLGVVLDQYAKKVGVYAEMVSNSSPSQYKLHIENYSHLPWIWML
jgi:hypothetical protein